MMDPSIGWFQSENKGPAQQLWMKLWKDFNRKNEGQTMANDDDNYTKIVSKLCGYFPQLKDNPSSIYDLDNNSHLISRHNGIPWRKSMDSLYEGIDGLHMEIQEFYNYIKPRPMEFYIRVQVQTRMTQIIETLWPDAVVECFGSFKTHTYLPTSDIDLVVVNHRWTYLPLAELEQHLLNTCQCLPSHIRVLDRASVPIIKMIDVHTGIRINISFNMPQVVKSVNLVNEYLKEYPNATKLLFIVKQFVLQRDFNEVFRGGLSSYSLVLMVVHFFKLNPDTHVDPDKSNLGSLLMRFLDLYGRKVNYEMVGLKVKDGIFVKKCELFADTDNGYNSRRHPSLFCIEDPLDEKNNVSKNSYNADKIRTAFAYAYEILDKAVGPNQPVVGKTDTILGRIIRITDEVIDKREALLKAHLNFTLMRPFAAQPANRGFRHNRRGQRGGNQRNSSNKQWNNQARSNHANSRPPHHQHVNQTGCSSADNSQQTNGPTNQRYSNGRHNRNGLRRFDNVNANVGHFNGQTHNNANKFHMHTNHKYNVCYYSFDRNPNQHRERAQQEQQLSTGQQQLASVKSTDSSDANDQKPNEDNSSTDKPIDASSRSRLRSNTCN